MIIFKKAADISAHLLRQTNENKAIGFAPTMGALHAGHLSLIAASKKENDLTVCSIFINPTQFNNADDFNHYPVTIEKDIELLEEIGCDVLFLPSAAEIYPAGYQKKHYELGMIENVLEGFYRPGHFQGVCQVVDRLLEIINPDRLYMGQKDFQQCMVVKKLVQLTGRNQLELHFEPTKREESGLAMSSRNLRLSSAEKETATDIIAALQYIKQHINDFEVIALKEKATAMLADKGFKVDYIEIARAADLEPVTQYKKEEKTIALVAAALGKIRLIDNMLLN